MHAVQGGFLARMVDDKCVECRQELKENCKQVRGKGMWVHNGGLTQLEVMCSTGTKGWEFEIGDKKISGISKSTTVE